MRAGAEVDARDEDLCTPLHYGAVGGSATVVRALIRSGADVNAQYHMGGTPLDLARSAGHADVAEIIAKAGGTERGLFFTLWRRPRL